MLYLIALLHTTAADVGDRLRSQLDHPGRDSARERGSVTIEHVAWAVAVLVFVGIVVAAIKAYVTSQAGNIK